MSTDQTLPAQATDSAPVSPVTDYPSDDGPLRWRPWSAATIAEAQRLGRPLLVYVATAGADGLLPGEDELVRSLAEERFVPVRVDPWLHPEIDRRYGGGWPCLAVVRSDGALVARAPDISPDRVRTFLLRMLAHLDQRPDVVAARIRPGSVTRGPIDPAQVMAAAGEDFDAVYGGFGGPDKHPEAALLRFLHHYQVARGGSDAGRMLRRTLDAILASDLWDMQDGPGIYAQTPSWQMPRREVDAAVVAGLLRIFHLSGAAGSSATGDRHATQELLRFIKGRLYDAEMGGFAGRRLPLAAGQWWTDPVLYVDRLAYMTWALYELGEAVSAEIRHKRRRAADTLTSMVDADGVVQHARRDGKDVGARGLLRDQMLVSLALKAAFEAEGPPALPANPEWAAAVQRTIRWTREHLFDEQIGAFHDCLPPDGLSPKALSGWPIHTPFADDVMPGGNALAARLYQETRNVDMARQLLQHVPQRQPLRAFGSAAAVQLQLEAAE
ncbi:MAG: DUF255 domain-containing protein [Gemmatimonadetes bacterium]|nr:DUF255 domain-containing protein [Gemmatimonadota bacterium]MBT7863606.1 DUF255 domain-containing protein [Gemmatimonadota bacterium]